jgi:DNA relaxase NicK
MCSSTTQPTGYVVMALYKNGTSYNQFGYAAATTNFMNLSGVGCLVYLNGTTDYVEWYINQVTGTNVTYIGGGVGLSLISANMVRAA